MADPVPPTCSKLSATQRDILVWLLKAADEESGQDRDYDGTIKWQKRPQPAANEWTWSPSERASRSLRRLADRGLVERWSRQGKGWTDGISLTDAGRDVARRLTELHLKLC